MGPLEASCASTEPGGLELFMLPPIQERSWRKLPCKSLQRTGPANPRIPDVPSRSLEMGIIGSEGNNERNLWCSRQNISVFSPLPTESRKFLARDPFDSLV